jgi:hypothetical protein
VTGTRLLNEVEQDRIETAARAFMATLAGVIGADYPPANAEDLGDLAGLAVQAVMMGGARQLGPAASGNAVAGVCAGVMAGAACAVRGIRTQDARQNIYRLMGDAFRDAATLNEQMNNPKGNA